MTLTGHPVTACARRRGAVRPTLASLVRFEYLFGSGLFEQPDGAKEEMKQTRESNSRTSLRPDARLVSKAITEN